MPPFEADENRPAPPAVVPPVVPPRVGVTHSQGPTLTLPRLASGLPDLENPIWLGYLINLVKTKHGLTNVTLGGMTNLIFNKIVIVHVTEAGYDIEIGL